MTPEPLRRLDDVVAERRVKLKDCRDCRNFEPAEDGLQYGWCAAHKQHVKLYHPPGSWYSQCLFKSLRRIRPGEPAGPDEQTPDPHVSSGRPSRSESA
jgi:hypothetical protein